MPATEQTWRDSKLMHLVFGLSSLAMLGTTIWMLAADHRREWKDFQRKFQEIETWTAEARISQQESKEFEDTLHKLEATLVDTRKVVPKRSVIDRFKESVTRTYEERKKANEATDGEPDFRDIDKFYAALAKAEPGARPALWDELRGAMTTLITRAKFVEDNLATTKKFLAADLEVARSQYDIGVGNELPKAQLEELQAKVDAQREAVAAANDKVQNATTHRKDLESILGEMTADEVAAKKELDDHLTKLAQLEKARDERQNSFSRELLQLPIIDAFGRPIKIEQVWLPKLTINYNFGDVGDIARFDRCVTCHQAIADSAPGSAVEPRYEAQHTVKLVMETPAEKPAALKDVSSDPEAKQVQYVDLVRELYGIQLQDKGLFNADDAMVGVVRPEKPAAKARLEMGDVIAAVGDVPIRDKRRVYSELLESVTWGQPVTLTVRRGVPHPYASHPRLDLFTGSMSPHKKDDVGCTICHDGQGSATAFKWASHSPNDPLEEARWKRQYGWFDNHHWIFPMTPNRFIESLCLKCHHEVTELQPSKQFPEPPAPKLVEGFQLIQDFGCYGCHEISGFDGPDKRVGPDLRTEPPYAPAAQALLATNGLTPEQQAWAKELAADPTNDIPRRRLAQSLLAQEKLPGDPVATAKLVKLLDELETPGKLRRVGPSLRHVGSKVGYEFLYSWINKPSDFRPSTKMPQFLGLHKHLEGKALEETLDFEPVEVRSATSYLLAKSQSFEYASTPKGVGEKASTERGKKLFETRGCLACHKHVDFPAGTMTQGPDLSRMGAKLSTKGGDGRKWLYTWLRNPSNYHARTFMPNMILEPIKDADGKVSDPAADITEYLMGSTEGWKPEGVPAQELTDSEKKNLRRLALEHLKTTFPKRQAEKYLDEGIPEDRRSELKGDEVELVGPMSTEKQLQYVGRRTISKYGCSGCHDIPGFEDAKPIGTGLADWGRKDPSKLDFASIIEYMKHGHGAPGRLEPHTSGDVTDKQIEEADEGAYGHTEIDFKNLDPDTGYFMEKLFGHQRQGFIWQKLREPRSYDYQKTQNKGYNERLRMPQFTALTDQQREAIITFVLGLVAEPPPVQYVYRPTPARNAIIQGKAVIDKFNCAGCHKLGMDTWKLAYAPDDFPDPPDIPDFNFLQAHFTPEQIKASLETDAAGLRHATLVGMPMVDEQGRTLVLDSDGAPIDPDDPESKDLPKYYSFVPWENALLNGQPRQAGLQNLIVPEARIEKRFDAEGGSFAKLAYAVVVAAEKAINPNVKAEEAWGWLPPPLYDEGRKVQTNWLHNFLLDPYPIRPAVVLRMPKFNMSPHEATQLVNYFAAIDDAGYPYDFDPRTRDSHLAAEAARYPDRLADALKIVVDGNYCVKCHLLGDYSPPGSERAKAPQLERVYKRMRPEYVLDWIANPKRLLPYTGMPVNIPHDKGVSKDLYKGTPLEQVNGVVDLLMNYDRYTESKVPIAPLIKTPPPEAQTPPAAAAPAAAGGPAQ